MAAIDTFTINGTDYSLQDAVARSTANTANANAINAVNNLYTKKNLATYVAPSVLYIDMSNAYGSNPDSADNQTKKYIATSSASLPSGADLGIVDTYYYDSNNIAVRLLDIRSKKVYYGYWWGYSDGGWQLWTEE